MTRTIRWVLSGLTDLETGMLGGGA